MEHSQSPEQARNIRAAIQGYTSGELGVSANFTLIYAGRIVDTCPAYSSFVADREERLDGYLARFGPGWLWYEPPLAGPDHPHAFASKGFCLNQAQSNRWRDLGLWPISMRFVADQNQVCRAGPPSDTDTDSGAVAHKEKNVQEKTLKSTFKSRPPSISDRCLRSRSTGATTSIANPSITTTTTTTPRGRQEFPLRSTVLNLIFDTGATFPMICDPDLETLGIDPATYAAQTVESIGQADGTEADRFLYEMHVGVGAGIQGAGGEGDSRPGAITGKGVGWPHEPGVLGGLNMVGVLPPGEGGGVPAWWDRLSGILPLRACYASAVPASGRIYLGEHRKEVLGAGRLPPYHRLDTALRFDPGLPPPASPAEVAAAMATPDAVMFVHRMRRDGDDDDGGGEHQHRDRPVGGGGVGGSATGSAAGPMEEEGPRGAGRDGGRAVVEEFVDHDLQALPGTSTYQRTINGRVVRGSVRQFGPGRNLPRGTPRFPHDDPLQRREHNYWLRKHMTVESMATSS